MFKKIKEWINKRKEKEQEVVPEILDKLEKIELEDELQEKNVIER